MRDTGSVLDILPSSGSEGYSRNTSSRRPRSRRRSASPNVVQVEWKLPARLRKPVREQLTQERAQRRRRRAVVEFQRRPLHTQALLTADTDSKRVGNRVRPPTRRFFGSIPSAQNQDVAASRPKLQLAPPPYIGSFVSQKAPVASPPAPKRRQQKPAFSYASGERDVPVSIGTKGEKTAISDEELFVSVDKSKRGVAAGVTFSLWPGNWFGKRQKVAQVHTSKKKLILPS